MFDPPIEWNTCAQGHWIGDHRMIWFFIGLFTELLLKAFKQMATVSKQQSDSVNQNTLKTEQNHIKRVMRLEGSNSSMDSNRAWRALYQVTQLVLSYLWGILLGYPNWVNKNLTSWVKMDISCWSTVVRSANSNKNLLPNRKGMKLVCCRVKPKFTAVRFLQVKGNKISIVPRSSIFAKHL